MLDLKALLAKILRCVYTTGTDNGWTYKKYADGTYEAWRTYNATGMSLTSASAGTYYNGTVGNGIKNITLPSFNVGTSYFAFANSMPSISSGVYIYSIGRLSATTLQIGYRAHASTTNGVCNGMFYVRGNWGGVINLIKYYLAQLNTFSFERGCVVC